MPFDLKTLTCGLLLASITTPVLAAGPQEGTDASRVAAMSSTDWCAADLAQDLEAKMALFSEDAVMIMPGRAPLEGRASIEAWQSQNYDMADHNCVDQVDVHDVEITDDLAIVRGRFAGHVTLKDGSASFDQAGYFLNVLQRDAHGDWHIRSMAFVY